MQTDYYRAAPENGPRIVVIGGGHGQSTLLRGLKLYSRNLTAIVTVADDGGGTRETVERLNRGLGSTKAEGLGLGLSIVKHVAELYGAKLTLSSTLGAGTEITVSFKK